MISSSGAGLVEDIQLRCVKGPVDVHISTDPSIFRCVIERVS